MSGRVPIGGGDTLTDNHPSSRRWTMATATSARSHSWSRRDNMLRRIYSTLHVLPEVTTHTDFIPSTMLETYTALYADRQWVDYHHLVFELAGGDEVCQNVRLATCESASTCPPSTLLYNCVCSEEEYTLLRMLPYEVLSLSMYYGRSYQPLPLHSEVSHQPAASSQFMLPTVSFALWENRPDCNLRYDAQWLCCESLLDEITSRRGEKKMCTEQRPANTCFRQSHHRRNMGSKKNTITARWQTG